MEMCKWSIEGYLIDSHCFEVLTNKQVNIIIGLNTVF